MRIAEKSERTTREKGEFLMKHKARTKALSWLLSLALALSLMPAFSLTAWAGDVTPYDVWVGGVQVTSANAIDVFGDGKVSYTPAIVDG